MTDQPLTAREKFERDPVGYAALAWNKWAILQNLHGVPIDPERPPSPEDLKSPALWLTQAQALKQAAVALDKQASLIEMLPPEIRSICDSQYRGVMLMLVGYSLEVALKAMTIMRLGVKTFMDREREFHVHKLTELAEFIPDLSDKDGAILKVLTHFVTWAGRYPDPGTKRHAHQEDVFNLSEAHQITAYDIFTLTDRILAHVHTFARDN